MKVTDYKSPRTGEPMYGEEVEHYGSSGRLVHRCLLCSSVESVTYVTADDESLAEHHAGHVEAWARWYVEQAKRGETA